MSNPDFVKAAELVVQARQRRPSRDMRAVKWLRVLTLVQFHHLATSVSSNTSPFLSLVWRWT
jgi:hypothetical protein